MFLRRGERLDPYDGGYATPATPGDALPDEISEPGAASRQVAAILRAEILGGERPPGSVIESQRELAARYGRSEATMNRALAALAADGLVQVGSGRRTTVLPHYRYAVTVSIEGRADDTQPAMAALRAEQARSGGAIATVAVAATSQALTVRLAVLAADPGRAAALAVAAVAAAEVGEVSAATVRAAPATG